MSTVWFRVGFDLNFVCHHRHPVVPLLYLVTHDRPFRYLSPSPFSGPSSCRLRWQHRHLNARSFQPPQRDARAPVIPLSCRGDVLSSTVLPPWNTRTFQITDSVTYVHDMYMYTHTYARPNFVHAVASLFLTCQWYGVVKRPSFSRARYPPCFGVFRSIISSRRLVPSCLSLPLLLSLLLSRLFPSLDVVDLRAKRLANRIGFAAN